MKIKKEMLEEMIEELWEHANDSVTFDVFYEGAEEILNNYSEEDE